MAEQYHNYAIKQNMFKRSFLSGFTMAGTDGLKCDSEEFRHMFISKRIDGIIEGADWGRLSFEYEIEDDMLITVYALAVDTPSFYNENKYQTYESYFMDPEISMIEKRQFFEETNAMKAVNKSDQLLYGQTGRYLYLMIDVMGRGQGTIRRIQVNNQGDIYMEMLPEVYREYGGFFHRYLSIFSTMYIDFQNQINHVDRLLDIQEAPVELLPVLAHWMGLDVSGDFLNEQQLRLLVKEAYQLNKMKGTKTAMERLTEIILGEKAIVLEKNVICEDTQTEESKIYDSLYGDKIYDVTLLIKSYVPEKQKSQLMFLLNQFKPVRSRLLIYFLDGQSELDNHAYLDMNAWVQESENGYLDERKSLDSMILLNE